MKNNKYDFNDLVDIVRRLRAPGGCPWDREQTHESLKENMVEESYEVLEAIDSGDGASIADESGDLLLQIIFHADIGAESGEYDIDDVTDAVCKKLIHRHPHVFGSTEVESSAQVLDNWDAIKRKDRGQAGISDELRGVSKYLPALMRCYKIQKKAKKAGFDIGNSQKNAENIKNLLQLFENSGINNEEFIGKLLFEVVSIARNAGIQPEIELNKTVDKFIEEFEKVEEK